jgi:sec-independent protein translocase protein TatA
MGPLGMQEMVFIFILALLIFGPKKLPELGKTLGKAMTEFRRASNELKSTFDREMSNLERETESHTKEISSAFNYDTYNYESSSYDSGAYGAEYSDSTATNSSIASASATQGAQLTAATQEVDGSLFVAALEGNTTTASEPAAPKRDSGYNGNGMEHQAVQG